jgi:hypothetical protein
MPRILRSLAVVVLALAAVQPISAQQEIDNVAAFARLYGVVRWFYPSDAAAGLDWNRFAIHGVSQVKSARTPADLEQTLEALFTPLGPGIEIGTTLPAKRPPGNRDASLIAWHHRGAALGGAIRGPYSARRVNRPPPVQAATNAPGVLMQGLKADTLRGKTIRMRGRVRVADVNAQGWAGLWLRVDRTPPTMGFFDNMGDRPVRDTAWREYVIEGPIAADATNIAFGALTTGAMTMDVDAIELAVRSEGADWTPLVVANASFESPVDWSNRSWAQSPNYVFTRSTSGPADGAHFMRIRPPTAESASAPVPPADSIETPFAGASIDVELARGLKARLPLSLTEVEARGSSTEPAKVGALRAAVAAVADPVKRDDADVRLADAVVAWNAFRHFYPYWDDIRVDWDARLKPLLQVALNAAGTRDGHFDALRALVAELRDGHGSVRDVAVPIRALGPLQLRIIGEQLVVIASRDPADVPVGSVVTAIDGVPAADRIAREVRLESGTLQWRQSRAATTLQICKPGVPTQVTIEPPSGAVRTASLPCERSMTLVREQRPDSIAELAPGIWYVDLTRLRAVSLPWVLPQLANARGVVFDVRGYPTDVGARLLPHLMNAAEDTTDRWMHVARITGPFRQIEAWQSFSWSLTPATPHIAARRVFLTDGRAISYAESVMGYVRDHKLGTIVGAATAGANGNVADFTVPGGFSVMFTGMRVTRHDGRTPFHMSGVSPDIPFEPTLVGIRAGRDELLERALALLRMQP